ncbi:hypothetical protein Tco_1321074 [Tanacetum coccineum]
MRITSVMKPLPMLGTKKQNLAMEFPRCVSFIMLPVKPCIMIKNIPGMGESGIYIPWKFRMASGAIAIRKKGLWMTATIESDTSPLFEAHFNLDGA